ncbi:hypothetical protein CPB83DRAFT_890756 [Crepidotus variabilis]|uniref:Uncharacterized protein n=1 Tax=Crepidotus variabilis TaxID=179855 RepID=A0A9P6ENQ4_9AGAR|nr:hypothetical protein CPB83DRAFT_890756 [Crepidotus variabilis]
MATHPLLAVQLQGNMSFRSLIWVLKRVYIKVLDVKLRLENIGDMWPEEGTNANE